MNYIDLMEKVFSAYTIEGIRRYTCTVEKNGLEEHGFPRLTANLGILISHGRQTELKDDFVHMMDLCCSEIPIALAKNGKSVGNDFSVKEIVMCLLEVEKAAFVETDTINKWKSSLAAINPYETYSVIAETPSKPIGNWAAFGAASEQVRKYAGIGDESDFIENQIESQLFSFDENGMYRDPNEPMVYDFVTRLQLAVALYFGFDGKCRGELEKQLLKSADITLKMQSVTGEIPFGGRSNQFLHNEAFYAAICEFYASWFKKRGDIKKAGMFKSAARIAVESLLPWLSEEKIHHVKNYYPTDSMYGCENYGYFDKYMITTGSWFYLAYIMADNTIEETACPSESGNYICRTSKWFHKVFCKYNDYFVQFDTNADMHYDCCGIGRIHKKGVNSALCMSVPFAQNPSYKIDLENPSNFSLCGGIVKDGTYICACNNTVSYRLIEENVTEAYIQIKFECLSGNEFLFYEICTVSDSGVEIVLVGDGNLEIYFPALFFDGNQYSEIFCHEDSVEIIYKGHTCRYSTKNTVNDLNKTYANRNGKYKAFSVSGENEISLKIELE